MSYSWHVADKFLQNIACINCNNVWTAVRRWLPGVAGFGDGWGIETAKKNFLLDILKYDVYVMYSEYVC